MSARDRHEKAKRWGKKSDKPLYEREDSNKSFDSVRQRPLEEYSRSPFSSTIRSVTPELARDSQRLATPTEKKKTLFASGPFHTSPPASPPQAVRHRHSQRDILRPAPARTTSDQLVKPVSSNGTSAAALQDQMSRPRTRTFDERNPGRDISPGHFMRKARSRVGSIASNASTSAYRGSEEPVTSIGHPSTIAAPSASASLRSARSERNRLAKPQRQPQVAQRSASPVSSSASMVDLPPRAIPTANARRIFHLMRSTCGRMEGKLAFRRGETSPWGLAHCVINDESGSLVYEPKSAASYYRTLISDLRGCEVRTALDPDSHHPYLDVIPSSSNLEVHLRPHSHEEFENWFAALLCWQPIKPKGIMNRMAKAQQGLTPDQRRGGDSRRHSEVSLREVPIIKVGKMIYWDTVVTSDMGSNRNSGRASAQRNTRRWRRVSCTLRENGELKMYSETDVSLVGTVQLSQLARCAIQRLNSSVLDTEYSIAIYPQYTSGCFNFSSARPMFLSLESRLIFESWLVLLRAFTVPQLYSPKPAFDAEVGFPIPPSPDMFRMERSIVVRIIQAKFLPPVSPTMSGETMTLPRHPNDRTVTGGLYAEVLLDGETRAKTLVRTESAQPFWREEFDFLDLPAALSVASIRLKERPDAFLPKERALKDEAKRMYDATGPSMGSGSAFTGSSADHTVGQVDIYLDDLEASKEVEKWWPLTNRYGQNVGEIQIGIRAEEAVILLARDYQELSALLHRFNNALTPQIAQVLSGQLTKLSEHLLNIFQVSGRSSEWLSALIEEEIDSAGGVETPRMVAVNRLRLSKRLGSSAGPNASREGFDEPVEAPRVYDRETFVRDMGKSAAVEANLLFRANTLCTKSLDLHMRRLGREYLDQTLGDKMREIADKDPDCEVDPNRVEDRHELERNWRRLLGWTSDVWKCIFGSWQQCPPELRLMFRHVMACAEDRFGDYLRTVRYSSVSGFLFLRFFCPAILGPKLFGLLKDDPKPKARRAITLIAKIIMSLANVATFGVKEPFMEPANAFLTSHRQQFKDFIDNICSIPTSTSPLQAHIHPNYSTPIAIIGRMPPPAREGFPSLPYLIDHARNFADLVDLWLENTKSVAGSLQSEGSGDLGRFHNLCLALQNRKGDVLAKAEKAERPNPGLEPKWEQLVDELARDMGVSLADSPMQIRSVNHVYASIPGVEAPGSSDGTRARPEGIRINTGASTSSATSQYSRSVRSFEDQFGAAERGMGSLDISGSGRSTHEVEDEAVSWNNATYMKSEEQMATALPSIGEQHHDEINGQHTIRGRNKLKALKEKDDDHKRSFPFKFGKKHKG